MISREGTILVLSQRTVLGYCNTRSATAAAMSQLQEPISRLLGSHDLIDSRLRGDAERIEIVGQMICSEESRQDLDILKSSCARGTRQSLLSE